MGNSSSSSGQMVPDAAVTRKSTERGESPSMNIRYAVSGMKGLRITMEDQHLHQVGLPVHGKTRLQNHALFAVFDGHGGDFTSSFLQGNFLGILSRREEIIKYADLPETGSKSRSDVNAVLLLQKALVKTFIELDEQLLPLQRERTAAIRSGKIPAPPMPDIDEGVLNELGLKKLAAKNSLGERSGSTAVVVLVTPTHIICANTGDSRAILRRDGKVLPLSFDHKPSELPERLRITDNGGFVKGKRVNGDLAVSRAFGDFIYKESAEVVPTKQKVAVVPEVMIYPRNLEQDEFLVLACDGIWDVASNKQCSEFVQKLLSEGESDLGNICEETLDTCLDRRSRDNMTMMIVGFQAMNVETSKAAVMNNALWGHRAARRTRNVAYSTISVTHNTCSYVGSNIFSKKKPTAPVA